MTDALLSPRASCSASRRDRWRALRQLRHRSLRVAVAPGASELPSLGRLGDLEVRLAASASEVRRAQALRYRVFYEEMSAVADFRTRQTRRDADRFDRFCDHLLVLDHVSRRRPRSGGRRRSSAPTGCFAQEVAERHGGFYSAGEFDLAPLLRRKPRSAIPRARPLLRAPGLPQQADARAPLARHLGLCAAARRRRDDRLRQPRRHRPGTARAAALLPPPPLLARRRNGACARADASARRDGPACRPRAIDAKAALRALPPLHQRVSPARRHVGDGAVIDRQFGTTDVAIVLPVAAISARYVEHYGADAGRYAVSRARRADAPLAAA